MALKFYQKAKTNKKKDIMSVYKHIPTRMCVVCRDRFPQDTLLRFRVKKQEFSKNSGRGFYICKTCIEKDEKILIKSVYKFVKISSLDDLKENVLYGGSSYKWSNRLSWL